MQTRRQAARNADVQKTSLTGQLGQLQIRESVGKIYRALEAWCVAWAAPPSPCVHARTCAALGGAARAARAPLSLTPGTLRANVSATSWTTRQGARPSRSSRPSRAPMRRRLLLAEPAPLIDARTALHAKEACCRPRRERPRAPLQQAEAQQAPRCHHRLPIAAAFAHMRRACLAQRLSLARLQHRVHPQPWRTQAWYPAHPTQLHMSSKRSTLACFAQVLQRAMLSAMDSTVQGACAHRGQLNCDCWPAEALPTAQRVSAFDSKTRVKQGLREATVCHKRSAPGAPSAHRRAICRRPSRFASLGQRPVATTACSDGGRVRACVRAGRAPLRLAARTTWRGQRSPAATAPARRTPPR